MAFIKRPIFAILLLLGTINAFSNNSIYDSLSTVLKQKIPDSIKIDELNKYIFIYSSNHPEKVLSFSDSAIALSQKIGDSSRLAYSINRKGVAYYYLGDYSNSLDNYFLALSIKEKMGDLKSIWREYNNIGMILRQINQYDEAIQYFKLALEYNLPIDRGREAIIWNNIGMTQRGQKKYEVAKLSFEKAMEINNSIGVNEAQASIFNNLGKNYYDQLDYPLAIECFNKSLEINRSFKNDYEVIRNLNNLALVYLAIKKYPEAKTHLGKAESLLFEINSLELKLDNLFAFGSYYTDIQDYRTAINYRNIYLNLMDSINSSNKIKQFNQLKTIANTEKEIEKVTFLKRINLLQEKKIETQKTTQIIGALFILFVLFLLYFVFRNLKIKSKLNKKLNERANEIERLNEKLKGTNSELSAKHDNLQNVLSNLQNAQKMLIQSEKMASLGILSSGIAHEINNPLNFIHGGATYIESYIKENFPDKFEEIKPMIDGINVGVKRATDIVRSLNQYNSSDAIPNAQCNFHSIIDDCLVMLNNKYKNKIEVKKNYTDAPYYFEGKEGKLHQAFLNILANAEQSIEGDGIVSITTKILDEEMHIEIKDNGHGIKPENMNKIFDPFYTTKQPGKGTGLGLAITYTIIQEHRGSIDFDSNIGKGTTVFFKFPIQAKQI